MVNKKSIDIVIGLLESTLGDISSEEADEVVEACIEILKGKKPKINNKAKLKYYVCLAKDMDLI